jgi:hypothetical protein
MSLAILSGSALFSEARVGRVLSIREYFNMARLVVLAQIDDQEEVYEGQEQCGVRYHATVLESFKGLDEKDSKKILFGRYEGLKLYNTYLLFINYENDVNSSYENMAKEFGFHDSRKNIMDLVACKGMVPGYVFNRKIQWEAVSHDVYFFGLIPEEMPSSIHVFQAAEGPNWSISTDELFPYLRTLRDHFVRHGPKRTSE